MGIRVPIDEVWGDTNTVPLKAKLRKTYLSFKKILHKSTILCIKLALYVLEGKHVWRNQTTGFVSSKPIPRLGIMLQKHPSFHSIVETQENHLKYFHLKVCASCIFLFKCVFVKVAL